MSNQFSPIDKIDIRIKYYLISWKADNLSYFNAEYGERDLSDLTLNEIKEIFIHATFNDSISLIED